MVFVVATRDPDNPLSVGLVIGGAALAVGALASAAFLALGRRGVARGKRREPAFVRGLRRGVMVGSAFGLIALLRVLDGLTPLTALFVVVPFVIAETVLSTRRA